jgi:ribulose-5-phosphate 4-epimerase/fuculose-1-phosphate aldolase
MTNEQTLREDLAAAFRMVAHFGWDDLIFTHMSVRVPGEAHHFLINRYNMMFDEVTASSLVKIDVQGKAVDDPSAIVNPAGFIIHSALHMAREDAHAVMHLHTPYGQAVSAMAFGLLPQTQTAMIAAGDVAYHDYEGLAVEEGERERLVSDMGLKNALILRNHGTLAVGETVGSCFLRLYFLERACEAQVKMLTAGVANLYEPPHGTQAKTAAQSAPSAHMGMLANQLAWPAIKRKVARLYPDFKN